jgi:beta-galactosidase
MSDQLGGRRIGISEYGAGASVVQHQEGPLAAPAKTGTNFHPEEWQAIVHERVWAQARDNPRLWGTFVWSMFDFAADRRNEGDTPGRNDKGLVTRDRKVRKDAFFFYKANWTAEPMVHLAARRMTPRQHAVTEVKAYSNCNDIELRLNGQSLGVAHPDAVRIVRWPGVTLAAGENRIELLARMGNREVRDAAIWVLEPAKP